VYAVWLVAQATLRRAPRPLLDEWPAQGRARFSHATKRTRLHFGFALIALVAQLGCGRAGDDTVAADGTGGDTSEFGLPRYAPHTGENSERLASLTGGAQLNSASATNTNFVGMAGVGSLIKRPTEVVK
jgi:hypothetical protein